MSVGFRDPWEPTEPETRSGRGTTLSIWPWFFGAACVAIPIVALGGVIPAAIGFGGAGGCVAAGRRYRHSAWRGFLACLGITVGSWTLFGAMLLVVFLMRGGDLKGVARHWLDDEQPVARPQPFPMAEPRREQAPVPPRLPWTEALTSDNLAAVKNLLDGNPHPDRIKENGFTPLIIGVRLRRLEAVSLLLAADSDPNSPAHGTSPLRLAVEQRISELVDLLLAHGADPNVTITGNESLIGFACRHDLWEIADRLAVSNAVFERPTSADFQRAIALDRPLVVRALMSSGYAVAAADWSSVSLAVREGKKSVLTALLQHGMTGDQISPAGQPLLHVAILAQQTEIIRGLLENGASVERSDRNGNRPLLLAAQARSAAMVRLLIDYDADVNQADHYERTALHHAVMAEDIPSVELLLKQGADVHHADRSGTSAWTRSLACPTPRVLELMLEHGVNVDQGDKNGETLLHRAAERDDLQATELLLAHGADANHLNHGKQTPLMVALHDDLAVAERLAVAGARLWGEGPERTAAFRSKLGRALLHATELGRTELVRALLMGGVPADYSERRIAESALHAAARLGLTDVGQVLIEHGADVHAVSQSQATPLFLALSENRGSMAELLIRHGATVTGRLPSGMTLLHLAARRDRAPLVTRLIEMGCPIESKDAGGRTPLYAAVEENALSSCRALVASGASVATSDRGRTPLLDTAVRNGNVPVVRFLLEQGVDPNGRYAVFGAIQHWRGSPEVLQLLIQYKADLEVRNSRGETPLIAAARDRREQLAEELLNHKVQINAVDDREYSALHWAAATGRIGMVDLLLKAGIDRRLKNEAGRTAAELARSPEIRDAIEPMNMKE